MMKFWFVVFAEISLLLGIRQASKSEFLCLWLKKYSRCDNPKKGFQVKIKYKARVGDRLTWQLSKDHLFRLNLCIKSALILHLFAKKVSWRSLAPNQFDQPTCRNQMLLYAAQTSGFSDKLSWPTLKTSFTLRPQDSTFHSSSKTTM